MPILEVIRGGHVPVNVWTGDLDEMARQQARMVASLQDEHGKPLVLAVSIMPDGHGGYGPPVGAVVVTKTVVIPYAVGSDIGCGMCAVRTNLTSADILDGHATALRAKIERGVPVGNGPGGGHQSQDAASGKWFAANAARVTEVEGRLQFKGDILTNFTRQLGSLGGGNHFIELCLDESDRVWIMLHSGSRRFGKEIADKHVKTAQRLLETARIGIIHKDLAYLRRGTPEFDRYLGDVSLAQDYAMTNRAIMLGEVKRSVYHFYDKIGKRVEFDRSTNCHHNYLAIEQHGGEEVMVTRKGAVRARVGDLAIIPGSMGTHSYIARGLGNVESFDSCSHGAGRRMSRGEAKRRFTADDLATQTAGVECRKDAAVIDEIPGAYKSIEDVMANQSDLVAIEHTLKQFVCIKG